MATAVLPPHILVIGGGPIGLEAAVSCTRAGFEVTVVERGETVGGAVRQWGHVRLFSTNALNNSQAGIAALGELGCAVPAASACPDGSQLVDGYLEPLGRWLEEKGATLLLGTSVVSVSRGAQLKTDAVAKDERRATPFAALVADEASGDERLIDGFAAVIDASGTVGGLAVGERALRRRSSPSVHASSPAASGLPREAFFDGIPDVLGRDTGSFLPRAGTRTVAIALVGSGHSASTVLRDILELAASRGNLYTFEVHWLLRKPRAAGAPHVEVADDPLPQRRQLDELANRIAGYTKGSNGGGGGKGGTPSVTVHRGCVVDEVRRAADGKLVLIGTREADAAATSRGDDDGGAADAPPAVVLEPLEVRVDTLVVQTGFRPSYDFASEMRVHLCYESEGPMRLAAAMASAAAGAGAEAASDCLNQIAPGPEQLTSPEPHFYVLGAKSYGRNSAFLIATGHKQVEAVVGLLQEQLSPGLQEADAEPPQAEQAEQEERAATAVQAAVRGRAARMELTATKGGGDAEGEGANLGTDEARAESEQGGGDEGEGAGGPVQSRG
jgi:threonine dehydrogenase-like Zn-dependent dehydrogenase